MKKVVVLGTGTAGLMAASMIKESYQDKVDVYVYYDKSQENIGVGEGTVPNIHDFLNVVGVSVFDLIKSIGATIKLGIEFKNWIPEKTYFHGFAEIVESGKDLPFNEEETCACYGIANKIEHGSSLYNSAETTIPNSYLNFGHAIHLDTVKFSKYLRSIFSHKIKFVDDILIESVIEDGKIKELVFENSGVVDADFYLDCSGFKSLLVRKLSRDWNDVSKSLPIDTAIPQQVLIGNGEIKSSTLSEATKHGWIWQIPVGNRYGTGYLYSSKFTSDEEAKEDFQLWLRKNHGVELTSQRIIRFSPGYYENFCYDNCAAIGLSSGFVEPLEATGIAIIIEQVNLLIKHGILFNDVEFDRNIVNTKHKKLYKTIIDFVSFHYNTNREDSDFWRYIKNNKTEFSKDLERKCRQDFISENCFEENLWSVDSYVQVANGLEMFDPNNVQRYMNNKVNSDYFISEMESEFYRQKEIKEENKKTAISHRDFLNFIKNKG